MNLTIHFDGACRGNGTDASQSGIGIYFTLDGAPKSGELALGLEQGLTNNQSEYHAVIYALEVARQLKQEYSHLKVQIIGDSQLVINQLNGFWKCSNEKIFPLFKKANELLDQLGSDVTLMHVERDFNTKADELSNLGIDQGPIRDLNIMPFLVEEYLLDNKFIK